ncbi:MAG: response regulator transcription factor, partial [Dermabacter sp.]|nr:response regulator transcription factor [Dermabacter sp.]
MSQNSPIRVIIADDQPMVRAGFEALLAAQADIDVVATAADGREAIDAALKNRPDIILMDIRMPNLDGLAAMEEIFRAGLDPAPRIIILTTFDADDYVFTALKGGASGFLLKDAEVEELVDAVRKVYRGGALLSPSITRKVIEDFGALSRSQRRTDPALTKAIAA